MAWADIKSRIRFDTFKEFHDSLPDEEAIKCVFKIPVQDEEGDWHQAITPSMMNYYEEMWKKVMESDRYAELGGEEYRFQMRIYFVMEQNKIYLENPYMYGETPESFFSRKLRSQRKVDDIIKILSNWYQTQYIFGDSKIRLDEFRFREQILDDLYFLISS